MNVVVAEIISLCDFHTSFDAVSVSYTHLDVYKRQFQVLISENLRFQRSVQRQDRPAEPLTADRERNRLRAGAGVPIIKGNAVAVLTTTALPAYQAGRLFLLRRCHAVGRAVRPAFQRRQSFDRMDADPSFLVVFNRL